PPLDEQWKVVVELSRPRVAAADGTLLLDAIAAIEPRRSELRQAVQGGELPELSAAESAGLDAFASWYQERGGLPQRTCRDLEEGGRRGLAAVTLAELALAGAPPAERPARAEAALYLAHRFREEGVNLLDVTIGSEIADDTIRWATENQVAPTAAFRELAPAPHVLARALAAEAQCMVELARQPGEVHLAGAELDGLRRFYLSAIAAVERGGSDQEIVARLAELSTKAQADRGHPTLAVLVPALGRTAERLLEQRRRYHAFLGGIR
ncbi:MAG TPA: hypothetical protein VFU21_21290, partial [Kofleriaceae bacterium]|nr:hypothetical protein [Kofleriaceae bacterium]